MRTREEFHTTKLHQAALIGNVNEVNLLLRNPKNHWMLTQADSNGDLPLDRAAPRGHDEVVKVLIDFHKSLGINYVIKNANGYHPLLSAAKWWFKVTAGATAENLRLGIFNIKNAHIAYPKIIKLLVENYASITKTNLSATSKDNTSSNALYYIVRLMSISKNNLKVLPKTKEIAQLLLNVGFSLNVRTGGQLDARTIAKQHNLSGVINSLEQNAKLVTQIKHENHSATIKEKKSEILKDSVKTKQSSSSANDIKPHHSTKTLSKLASNPFCIISEKTDDELQVSNPKKQKPILNISVEIQPNSEKNYTFTRKFLTKELKKLFKDFDACQNREEVILDLVSMFKNKTFSALEQEEILESLKNHIDITYQASGLCCWRKKKATLSLDQEALAGNMGHFYSQKCR